MFPSDHLKPKHHYLLHYASLILKLGPLIRLWTMRFEIKHSYFKRCVRRIQNFKNINQHQLLQTTLSSNFFFAPVLKTKNVTPDHAHLYSDAVRNAVEAHVYRTGFCVNKESDESIKFGQIELVFIVNDKKVCFLVTPHT